MVYYSRIIRVFILGLAGVCISTYSQTENEETVPSSGEESNAPGQQVEKAATADWRVFEADDKWISMQLPTNGWKAMTGREVQDKVGGGCVPRKVPQGLLLLLQNEQKSGVVYLLKSPEKIVFKDESALRSYVQKQQAQMAEQAEESGLEMLNAELTRKRAGFYVNRLEFEITHSGSSGGCASGQAQGQAETVRRAVVENFIRPAGQNSVVLYQLMAASKSDAAEVIMPIVSRIEQSFEYRGETAQSLFIPEAEENQLPPMSDSAGGGRSTPWGLYTLLFIAGLYFFWRWKKRQRQA
ncbi:MAG: hypothetical protein R6V56_07775 [Lentisphaeria bacterium]